ncbi:MAG: flagellar hook-associated protein FlgK, partial [Sulfurimonas sp.]|nr:flagellar hook-associated protein FlgK [Sulfurimonas sp.]
YTRQRVVTAAATPVTSISGQVGNGATITDIKRVFDNFVFDRYTSLSSDKEYSDFTQSTLEELSTYFPEIDEVGIKSDLKEYYNMWQNFSDNPDNDAIKLALAKQTETLSQSIANVQNKIIDLQASINDQLLVNINEINVLAKELAGINVAIEIAEAGGGYTASDLRDKRNFIETNLARLIGAESSSSIITSDIGIDSSSNTSSGSYTVSVAGFNIVDGSSYHPIHISNEDNKNGFYELSYERQDGVLISMSENIKGGKVGAILDLRGSKIEENSGGVPADGVLQNVISQMDSFASKLIESTNNLYAASATTKMESNLIDISQYSPIANSSLNVKTGAFDIIVYDIDGNETARRTIDIDAATSMSGLSGSNSIEGKIKAQGDDNSDGNANNDIDDYIDFNWASYASGGNALEILMDPSSIAKGYTFSIEDNLQTSDFNS